MGKVGNELSIAALSVCLGIKYDSLFDWDTAKGMILLDPEGCLREFTPDQLATLQMGPPAPPSETANATEKGLYNSEEAAYSEVLQPFIAGIRKAYGRSVDTEIASYTAITDTNIILPEGDTSKEALANARLTLAAYGFNIQSMRVSRMALRSLVSGLGEGSERYIKVFQFQEARAKHCVLPKVIELYPQLFAKAQLTVDVAALSLEEIREVQARLTTAANKVLLPQLWEVFEKHHELFTKDTEQVATAINGGAPADHLPPPVLLQPLPESTDPAIIAAFNQLLGMYHSVHRDQLLLIKQHASTLEQLQGTQAQLQSFQNNDKRRFEQQSRVNEATSLALGALNNAMQVVAGGGPVYTAEGAFNGLYHDMPETSNAFKRVVDAQEVVINADLATSKLMDERRKKKQQQGQGKGPHQVAAFTHHGGRGRGDGAGRGRGGGRGRGQKRPWQDAQQQQQPGTTGAHTDFAGDYEEA